MMKASNPESKANRDGRVDPFWPELLEKPRRLNRRQLIACPDSEFHDSESAVSPFREELLQLLRQLSAGVRFWDHITIQKLQIHAQIDRWMSGQDPRELDLKQRNCLIGDPSTWTDVLIVSVNIGDPDGYIDELRHSREEGHEVLQAIFDRWQAEARSFEDTFLEESRRWALALPLEYKKYLERQHRVLAGEAPLTLDLMFPPGAIDLMRAVLHGVERAGVEKSEIWPKAFEYLASGLVILPSNRLRASLWATLATQAKSRARAPGRGMSNDVQMISTLLPYCDAMLIDRECHGLLRNIPASHRPKHACRVFSASNKEECLEFLDEIDASASAEHIAMLREVYGDRIA